ncbi:MAG TPA: hypothetical protein VM901_08660 [Bdellovibrionota bacterium]|jgi:hypothetical protein|nr:hypothetical protein [Bdellovibrionota bacterium]
MNKFTKLALVGLISGFSSQLRAEALDGYIALTGGLIKHMSASDQSAGKASRYMGRLDFVRVQKNVALDLRFGSGMDYQDMGGAFKVFHHFAFSGSTATGISLGGGLGGMYSRAGVEGTNATFYELFSPVFARVIFDMGLGFGLLLDAEYNAMFQRRYPDGEVSDNSKVANRFFFGAGIAITAM